MEKLDIRDLSYEELVDYLKGQGQKPYRAKQIFAWIYKKGAASFNAMTNLSLGLREILKNNFTFSETIVAKKEIASDATIKFLFDLDDYEKVESVLIPTATRTTVCVSTQAGCKFSCQFCASGIGGWTRNLNCAEILEQILYAQRMSQEQPLSHIVFMGTGEPLDNYDHLMKAIRTINAEEGMNIAARRITISTVGLVPKIKKLVQEGIQVELAVSLHGSNNDIRNTLMPVNKRYPLSELIETCKEYIKATNRQVTFEYILIKDLTCTDKAALELSQLLKGMLCKLNLIPYNRVAEFAHKPPSLEEMIAFRDKLIRLGIHATLRSPRGRDVSAACGQLRHYAKIESKIN